MTNNLEAIYLDEFKESVKDGLVNFLITDAKYDTIKTKKNEVVQIVKLTVEVQEFADPSGEREIKHINIFLNMTPGGRFHKFVQSALTAVQTKAFTPNLLIGLKGKADLSHYTPEGSDFSFPRMNNWVFYAPTDKVVDSLEGYLDANIEDLV